VENALSSYLSHLMDRRQVVRCVGAVGATLLLRDNSSHASSAKPRRVLFFTKSSGYQHSVIKKSDGGQSHAERILTDLGKQNNFEVTATKDGSVFTTAGLRPFDVIFFYTTGDLTQAGEDKNPPMSVEGKAAFLDAIRAGKGFVGTHSASDTFHSAGEPFATQAPEQRDPYIQMLGGEFIRHGAQQEATLKIAAPDFPGSQKLGRELRIKDEWYSLKNFSPDLHVILVQSTQGMEGTDYQRPNYPATWARRHGKGRVFYTSMGHREDVWINPMFQAILLGGISWAAGAVKAQLTPNMTTATPQGETIPPKPSKT
jgi:uncharacterized protein